MTDPSMRSEAERGRGTARAAGGGGGAADWRHQTYEQVLNFRDFGGYGRDGRDGRTLPKGRLYRSAHFARASEADIEAMHRLGIGIVADLRSEPERIDQPSRFHADFKGRLIEATGEQATAPHRTAAAGQGVTREDVRRHMIEAYRGLPYRGGLVDAFSRTFEALAETPGPLLIHCAAGKDRTGVLAALIHHIAGVNDDDIMADYLLTNRVEHPQARLEAFSRWLGETYGGVPDEAAVRVALGVEPVFLESAWAAMRERDGGVDGYLERTLGVTPERRQKVEAALLG